MEVWCLSLQWAVETLYLPLLLEEVGVASPRLPLLPAQVRLDSCPWPAELLWMAWGKELLSCIAWVEVEGDILLSWLQWV